MGHRLDNKGILNFEAAVLPGGLEGPWNSLERLENHPREVASSASSRGRGVKTHNSAPLHRSAFQQPVLVRAVVLCSTQCVFVCVVLLNLEAPPTQLSGCSRCSWLPESQKQLWGRKFSVCSDGGMQRQIESNQGQSQRPNYSKLCWC